MLMTLSMPLAAEMEWSQFRWVVYVAIGLIGLFYAVVPLLILGQQKFEARPRMVRFNPQEFDLPAEIDQLFSTAVADLSGLGFEMVDGLFLPSAVPNVQTALLLLVNRTERDAAIVTAVYATGTQSGMKSLYVEFSTEFNDGFEYNTNNSTQLSSFPTRSNVKTRQFVEATIPSSLYRIHQAVMNRDGRDTSQKVLELDREFGGDPVAFLQHGMLKEFEAAAAHGYVRLTANGETFRPTVKGAFLMVWKELWPWKRVRHTFAIDKLNR